MRKVTEIIDFLGVELEVTTSAPVPAVVVAPEDALEALRVGFTIESEGVTLPWKIPVASLDEVTSIRELSELTDDEEGPRGFGPIVALGGMSLPIVKVTDRYGARLVEQLMCYFPLDREKTENGAELFDELYAKLTLRLGASPIERTSHNSLLAHWKIDHLSITLGTVLKKPISETSRTWIWMEHKRGIPFTPIASGPIRLSKTVEEAPEPRASSPAVLSCEQLYLLRPAQGLPSRQEGLREVRVAQVPILGPTFCFSSLSEPPCTTRTFGHQKWFVGSGIRAAEHPVVRDGYEFFANEILRSGCGACDSLDVSVLAFASGASMGGTTTYALEVRCPCGAYTSYGYSDD